MHTAVLLISLAAGVLAGVVVARRLGVPAPLVLVVAGVAASFLPFVPQVHLEPEVVLIGLLPPLLYAAAISSSLVDFNTHRRPILLLSVGLVIFTTAGVGCLVHALIPGLPWAVAFAVGAVVAPPDAVAATAIGRNIGLPRKIVTILEGESLFNDATALVLLNTARAAIGTAAAFQIWEVGLDFAIAAAGGVAIGLAAYWAAAAMRRRITEPAVDVALSLVLPFFCFVLAEEIHASGVVAVVVAGLLLGHRAPILQTAQSRIAERVNWSTIAFLLENAVFALIGLQAQWLFQDLADSELGAGRIATVCLATLAAVIVLRLVWVVASHRVLFRRSRAGSGHRAPWSYTFLLGWAGMRGVVTLAAAFVIPSDVEHREVLVMIAFTVVAGTLLIQGLSLPWLARRLRVPSPDPLDDALARATLLQQASKAALEELDELEYDDQAGVVDLIRQRLDQRNFAAWERLGTRAGEESPAALYYRIRSRLIEAERRRILEIRGAGQVPSEVVADVLAMLDVEESMLDSAEAERDETAQYAARRWQIGDQCDHLARSPAVDEPPATACPACLEAGTVWVSLRRCLECGEIGCCDSSPLQHATQHFHQTQHPVMQSAEPGEDWRWCYVHHLTA